ncbi:MAG: DUF4352 domain-containing protein [Eubacterium sp.]|nr:DUF4352 domain-containing protein [Eubacterium sp.]
MNGFIKKACVMGSLVVSTMLLLTGCGEEPYELQDNERDIIVNYAAHIVSKYNTKQPEGYRFVYVPEEDPYLTEEEDIEDAETTEEAKENSTDDTENQTDANEGSEEGAASEEQETVSLTEALGLKHIQAIYTGAELTDQYDTVIPSEGNQLLVVHVALQNDTSKERKCDVLALLPMFHLTINGETETTSELTILEKNLGTWEGKIPAGASEDTVILFQVKEGIVAEIKQLDMDVIVDESVQHVTLLDEM